MNKTYKFLTFEEQKDLFKERGMKFEDESNAIETLKFINYYKIKEFSLPFLKEDGTYKDDTYFEVILDRFYWDKNLRLYFLRITEKIEIFLKTQVSHILSREFGGTGYLKFKNWIDKNNYCRAYTILKEKEFKNKLRIYVEKNKDKVLLRDYTFEKIETFPIWLAFELLTFGDIIDLYLLLDKKYKTEISNVVSLKPYDFETWLKNIRLVRNLSAHHSNIIDMYFETKPKIQNNNLTNILYLYSDKDTTSNKIALSIVIMEYLVFKINSKFPGGAIKKALKHLCIKHPKDNPEKADIDARRLGFKNFRIIENLKI